MAGTVTEPIEDAPESSARAAGLRYVSDRERGFARRRRGRGFQFIDVDGGPLPSEQVERIVALAIPPAWTDVWICRSANGHLQATGRDARGRKQYRYHPRWREVDEDGKVVDIDSDDVNRYLNEVSGDGFTAKDFRTWSGTVLAAWAL